MFASIFAKDKLKSSEKLPEKLNTTVRVVRDHLGRFFLCIPQYAKKRRARPKLLLNKSIV